MSQSLISTKFFNFIKNNLVGAGQVLFQNNPITGLLFIIGIFWTTLSTNLIHIGIGAIVGLLVSTTTAYIFNFDKEYIQKGLYGYNGILLGIAVPSFLKNEWVIWLFLILGASCSTIIMNVMSHKMSKWKLSPLTFPFVFVTWFILLIADSSLRLVSDIDNNVSSSFLFYLEGAFNGISQVFLINNYITGFIFFIALAVSSVRSAILALIGSTIGLFIALFIGIDRHNIFLGLYGYSSAITAIALGDVFFKPSLQNLVYSFIGTLLTVLLQIVMNCLFSYTNLPTLTAPFIFITWLFVLAHSTFFSRYQLEN